MPSFLLCTYVELIDGISWSCFIIFFSFFGGEAYAFKVLNFYLLTLKLPYVSHFMASLCLKDECNEDVMMNRWQPRCIE